MDLERLKIIIDTTIKNLQPHQLPHEIPVIITLSNNSVGARGGCDAKYAGMGFDWEHGQFRIEPSDRLVKLNASLNDILNPIEKQFNNRRYYTCRRCESKVGKEDKYCKYCGQKQR